MIVSLILGFLWLQARFRGETPGLVQALILSCAVQGVVISLNQYYGLMIFGRVQPVTAAVVPPLAWVAFQAVAVRGFDRGRDLWHAAIPLFTAFCVVFAPQFLDQIILLIFVIYGGALLIALRTGRDSLLLTRLDSGEVPLRIWRMIGCALILSGVSDGLIVAAQVTGHGDLQPLILAVFSSVFLLSLGALGLSQSLAGAPVAAESRAEVSDHNPEEDAALIARLGRLLAERPLYLDPSLTLGQLARRLHVPAKGLSAAINRGRGENVSRLINGYRIDHACGLLANGENVTEAMLASGFNTKSNFNREFLRVKGQSPTEWLGRLVRNDQDVVDKPADAP
ncbi:MAG: AraC-like DNA-binding protein [Pseudorhodobacter sp.]|jgi:AraC-like DNA-binding protein